MTRTDGLLIAVVVVVGLGWAQCCSLTAATGPAGIRLPVPRWQTPERPRVRPAVVPVILPRAVPGRPQPRQLPDLDPTERAERAACLRLFAGSQSWLDAGWAIEGACENPNSAIRMRLRNLTFEPQALPATVPER